jgi:23S rRNA pseudouridine2605 synthase
MMPEIRLQKFLAQCGIASRRKAEQLIADGKVAVDGKIVKEMGVRVTPETSTITCWGKIVVQEERLVYFLLNKPKGYVTTVSDPQGRPVVTSLLNNMGLRLFPVGRLDLDTEGALILTNDGQFAQKVQHPSHETNKTYEALVKGIPKREMIMKLEKGVTLEGKMTYPANISTISKKGRNTIYKIIIHEDRKRQVRKMFDHIGHPVLNLKRTAYGQLKLGTLGNGKYRQLNSSELKKIFL